MDTSVPVGGTITTGVFRDRSNTTYPDFEQEKRSQAREESKWAAGDRTTHPAFTRVGPDDPSNAAPQSSNRNRATAEADGTN